MLSRPVQNILFVFLWNVLCSFRGGCAAVVWIFLLLQNHHVIGFMVLLTGHSDLDQNSWVRSWPGPEEAKQPQTITLPWLTISTMLCIWDAALVLGLFTLVGPHDIFHKLFRFFFVAECRRSLDVPLLRSSFGLRTLPWWPCFSVSPSYC